jgi:hypothetical protein
MTRTARSALAPKATVHAPALRTPPTIPEILSQNSSSTNARRRYKPRCHGAIPDGGGGRIQNICNSGSPDIKIRNVRRIFVKTPATAAAAQAAQPLTRTAAARSSHGDRDHRAVPGPSAGRGGASVTRIEHELSGGIPFKLGHALNPV